MQYEIVLKVMGVVHIILAFLKVLLLLKVSRRSQFTIHLQEWHGPIY